MDQDQKQKQKKFRRVKRVSGRRIHFVEVEVPPRLYHIEEFEMPCPMCEREQEEQEP